MCIPYYFLPTSSVHWPNLVIDLPGDKLDESRTARNEAICHKSKKQNIVLFWPAFCYYLTNTVPRVRET